MADNYNLIGKEIVEQRCEQYLKTYRDQIELFESRGMHSRIGESATPFMVYSLGRQLELYEQYCQFVESRGSVADLGVVPSVALDVITATNISSIVPMLASVQPMDEERGIVYYKQVTAETTDGGFNKGDVIYDTIDGRNIKYSGDFGAARKGMSPLSRTADGVKEYSISIGQPVRPSSLAVAVTVDGVNLVAEDNGRGLLMGNGIYGGVNYDNGNIELTFAVAPTSEADIFVGHDINVELQDRLPQIQAGLQSTDIQAEVFALQSEIGLLQEFSFSKRFGRAADEETARDLTNEMVRVLNTRAIQRLDRVARGNTTWYNNAPKGVARVDHKDSFNDVLADAEATLNLNSGRGSINRLVAGSSAASILSSLAGFTKVEGGVNHQVGLYGYLNGIPVVRATKVMKDNEILAIYRGAGYFEAPLVYAPYMPLFVSNTIQSATNPMRNTKMAAIWAGMKPVIESFVTRITVDMVSKNPQDVAADQ